MKKGRKVILGILSALLVLQTMPVLAAEGAEIFLKGKQDSKNDKQVDVECNISKGNEVTNGKLRIYYDGDKVKLLSNSAKEGLADALCEVNDCINGNKPEGEIVVAFASSQNLQGEGALLGMKFELKDGVKKDDKIEFRVQVDKLSGDNGDITAKEQVLTYIVGKEGEQTSQPGDEPNKDTNDTNKDPEKKPGNSANGNNGNSGQNNKTNYSGSGKTSKSGVNTGDETDIAKYLVLAAGTLLLMTGGLVAVARKKKKG